MAIFNSTKTKIIFFVIIVAAILRFWYLASADMINDEIYYTFRAIGYLDYMGTTLQTTPLDWFVPLPKWTVLSFHDHPPLVFLLQHIFFKIFGVSVFVARLPFALAGIISVFLIYLITKKLFDDHAAIFTSGFLAILALAVWISRAALMESVVIMLILLSWYLFLQALEKQNYWYFWGIAVGLSFLAKYTAFPLLAIFLIYLAIYFRPAFKNYRFYLAPLLIFIVFSPVIIYNILLFSRTGHFDLQLAASLGQKVSEWQTLEMKVSGTFLEKFLAIGPAMLNTFSPATLTFLILAFIFAVFFWLKEKNPAYFFPISFLLFYFFLFTIIKPQPRFVATIIPFVAILIGQLIAKGLVVVEGLKKKILVVGIGVFFLYELIFSINTNLTLFSWGWPNLTFSLARPHSADFGVNNLNKYLDKELAGITSAVVPQTGKKNLDDFILAQKNLQSSKRSPAYILLIYDPRLNEISTLWLFDRRFIYEAIPVTYADDFVKMIKDKGSDSLKNYNIYYITGTSYALYKRIYDPKTVAITLEKKFISQGLQPEVIYNNAGLPVFKVYKFSL